MDGIDEALEGFDADVLPKPFQLTSASCCWRAGKSVIKIPRVGWNALAGIGGEG